MPVELALKKKKKGKRVGYMQIILNAAKWIKTSSRVSSKLPTCGWRRNNHRQHEDPLENASWCGDVKWTEPKGWPKNLCLRPEQAKPEGHCCEPGKRCSKAGQGKGSEQREKGSEQREKGVMFGPLKQGRGSFYTLSCPPPGLGSNEILVQKPKCTFQRCCSGIIHFPSKIE